MKLFVFMIYWLLTWVFLYLLGYWVFFDPYWFLRAFNEPIERAAIIPLWVAKEWICFFFWDVFVSPFLFKYDARL